MASAPLSPRAQEQSRISGLVNKLITSPQFKQQALAYWDNAPGSTPVDKITSVEEPTAFGSFMQAFMQSAIDGGALTNAEAPAVWLPLTSSVQGENFRNFLQNAVNERERERARSVGPSTARSVGLSSASSVGAGNAKSVAGESSAGVVSQGGKTRVRYFHTALRGKRPGTVKPGTNARLEKKQAKDLHRSKLLEIKKLGINDLVSRFKDQYDLHKALGKWLARFVKYGANVSGGQITIKNLPSETDEIDPSTGKVARDEKGHKKKVVVAGSSQNYSVTWEQWNKVDDFYKLVLRGNIDFIRAMKTTKAGRTAPDHEFRLQNALIFLHSTFVNWIKNERFGDLDADFRENLLLASQGNLTDQRYTDRVDDEGNHHPVYDQSSGGDDGDVYAQALAAAQQALNDTGDASRFNKGNQSMLSLGFTTSLIQFLLRIALKKSTSMNGFTPLIGATKKSLEKFNAENPSKSNPIEPGIERLVESSGAMVQHFYSEASAREYAVDETSTEPKDHKTVLNTSGVSTFGAIGNLFTLGSNGLPLFPKDYLKRQEDIRKAQKGKRYKIKAPNVAAFEANDIIRILYLNGFTLSFLKNEADKDPRSAYARIYALLRPEEAGLTAIRRVVLRESRFIHNFYSYHFKKAVVEEPKSVQQIYHFLQKQGFFKELSQKAGLIQ